MADLVYCLVMRNIKQKILDDRYQGMRLSDERNLSEVYRVGRSSIKRALGVLAQQGVISKERGSGTLINPLYLKDRSSFHYEGNNLGTTNSFQVDGRKQGIKLLDYQVVPASKDVQEELFLNDNDFVYQIKRLRLTDDQPFMIETGFISIKIMPTLSPEVANGSIFNYLEDMMGKGITESFMTIGVSPSTNEDQNLLKLNGTESVGTIEGAFLLDDGIPFEVSNMRIHYEYTKHSTFVSLDQEN